MRLNVLLTVLLTLPVFAQASVASDIAALEQAKGQRGAQLPDFGLPGTRSVRAVPAKPPRMMTLTDGRQVNLNDYAVVVFMQRGCQYSAKFDPLLKSWTDSEGIKVYPYSLDGYGDAAFPVALIPRKAGPNEPIAGEILTFFGNGLPIATPTTFMVNVNTNVAYPLFQGETDMGTMSQRLAQMIEADIDNLPPDTLGPVPSSASLTPQ
ncbi:F-type conjugal transfer protein TrbB [Pantoea sp. EKM20T]|uniref:F-type conjugal transfer protein TrbB n=1 Tax=Pantoea sp. EKM20T TaxID=2708059 RepID=UPI00142D572E|nr:F-type conjugal transfer protein TrbB [Pantoea sp. EKM20T]KAF6677098.1 F-type conjugal transfer protein TrbB [Pantoea sp. EKM20T]